MKVTQFFYKFPRLFFWQAAIVLFLTVFVIIAPYASFLRFANIFDNTNAVSFFHDHVDILYYYDVVDDFFVEGSYPPANTYPPLTYLAFLFLRFVVEFFGGSVYDYIMIFHALMGVCLILALGVFHRILRILGRSPLLSWFFFLPSFLYFTFSRFDILVLLFLLLSIFFLLEKKYIPALTFLALTFVLKWFTVVLVPFFFIYILFDIGGGVAGAGTVQKDSTIIRRALHGWGFFGGIIVLTHVAMAGFLGFAAVYQPYVLQLGRLVEIGSFLASLIGGVFYTDYEIFSGLIRVSPLGRWVVGMIFTLAQFFPVFFILLWAKRLPKLSDKARRQEFLLWVGLLIANFVFWNRVYSPQWIIWFLPLLVLPSGSRRLWIGLVVYDLLNYAFFPYGFFLGYQPGEPFILLHALSLVRSLILFIIIVLTVRELLWRSNGHFLSNTSPSHDS